jgi:hypothetical protein
LLLSTRKLSIEAEIDEDSEKADEYCTTYSCAEGPDSSTRYEYVPGGNACSEERISWAAGPLSLTIENLLGEKDTRLELETTCTVTASEGSALNVKDRKFTTL